MNKIQKIFAKHGSDKTTSHKYENIYEFILPYSRELDGVNVMEIGFETGAGINGLSELLPNKNFVSLDIKFIKQNNKTEQIYCDTGDTEDLIQTYQYLNQKYGSTFSLIIDDGSHILSHQLACLDMFWDLLQQGGIYLIEDIFNIDHANTFCKWPGFFVTDTRAIGQQNDICVILRKPND